MIRYLVKQTSIATNENPNFAGIKSISYYGKNQEILAIVGDASEATYTNHRTNKYMILLYGYSRECDARRSWIYKNPENTKYWKSKVEIIKVIV